MFDQTDLNTFHPFGPEDFEWKARKLYALQIQENTQLARFANIAFQNSAPWNFFPIELFRSESLSIQPGNSGIKFESSGTSGNASSFHLLKNTRIYDQSLLEGFRYFYPEEILSRPMILALLPSYLERGNSSLVYMVKKWMDTFGAPGSGFYLHNFQELSEAISAGAKSGTQMLIIGVTYALLDFFEAFPVKLPPETLVIETGGMKGRKTEMTRPQVHHQLSTHTGLAKIHSEYSMTELLSQAYSQGEGHFFCPPWMQVEIREINDVSVPVTEGKSGRICIIDLANVWSCAFIATGDIGKKNREGSFEVLGRADTSGVRGCSLLYTG